MKVAFVAAVIAALAVTAAESLSCVQCSSWEGTCDNENASECDPNASSSCVNSLVQYPLEGSSKSYQDMFCSKDNCPEKLEPFGVRLPETNIFYFSSNCCQTETCKEVSPTLAPVDNDSSNIMCPTCFGSNEDCEERQSKCNAGEQCISLRVIFSKETQPSYLVLKGCSNISNSTCDFLSAENTIGNIVFQEIECSDGNSNNTDTTTTTTTTTNTTTITTTTNTNTTTITTTTNTTTTAITTTTNTTTTATTTSASFKASFSSWALASLLLGLLL